MEKPKGYEDCLGSYGPVAWDGYCGEIFAYGFHLTRHLPEEKFNALRKFGKLICLDMGKWVLALDWLTPKKAEEKYGSVTQITVGPRGGWRSVTYGNKAFVTKELDPRGVLKNLPEPIQG